MQESPAQPARPGMKRLCPILCRREPSRTCI